MIHKHRGDTAEQVIGAVDAKRRFSKVLRDVQNGQSYVITRHGKAIARISPIREKSPLAHDARKSLLRRLRAQPSMKIGRWNRESLYE